MSAKSQRRAPSPQSSRQRDAPDRSPPNLAVGDNWQALAAQGLLGNEAIKEMLAMGASPPGLAPVPESDGGPYPEGPADTRRSAAWTTGRPGGRGGVTSQPLDADGDWSATDFLEHHSDRSGSWAANNIRDGRNQDLDAYDFTFEALDEAGNAVEGSAQGLPLITPFDAKVHDIQSSYQGSGGYGRFIALEDMETGLRLSIHHLDTVGDFRKGQVLDGGTEFGTQGGSGNTRHQYATHVDVVGTQEAVEAFVRANQSGEFSTRVEEPRA